MSKMRVAVIGGGISGMASAYVLAKEGVEVVIYEKEDELGGHAKTVTVDGMHLDIAFVTSNWVSYPNMVEFFESLGVDLEPSDMSLSVSLEEGQGCEWGTGNGLSSLFAQKKNILNPSFWKMIREITRFKVDLVSYLEELESNPDLERNQTMEHFVQSRGYSEFFQKAFLIPTCASIWSCSAGVMNFSAYYVLSFLRNHHALKIFDRPQWPTQSWRSQSFVKRVLKLLEGWGCQMRINTEIYSVLATDEGCTIISKDGLEEAFDYCIIATPAPDALKMLGKQTTYDESRILRAFRYIQSAVFLHHDESLMPRKPLAWSSLNFLGTTDSKVYITYWLKESQNILEMGRPYLLTLNPPREPKSILLKWTTNHPIPSIASSTASSELNLIQGKRRIWFCGSYQGCGFPEDGLMTGIHAANALLGNSCTVWNNPNYMVPSLLETGARLLVTRFFERFTVAGCIILFEEGGSMLTFKGTRKTSFPKVSLRIHTPQFYWKIAAEADLGLADAYINGDFTFVDKNEGLLNLSWGWWTPVLLTSAAASTKYFLKHVLRKNTISQARKNISLHYDLNNELFSLFLGETMQYSCAIFEFPGEDLKTAQLRKIHRLIEKARISKEHHILEIGCGWGIFAIEAVKLTGCKYTGITISKKQLQYTEQKVKEAGLQDKIKVLLCDYRELSSTNKYDRIIACEMIECIGHEYVEEFFKCCESTLAKNGVFVMQFIAVADEKYDENRLSPGFIKEYIFPGGNLPSLARITSAMVAASRLSIVHLEDIGLHYWHTLRFWRQNFLQNQSQILALGFNEQFIRTWEYYFDYCAAGFKSCFLRDYQVIFTRPGDVATLGDPYSFA